MNHYVTGSRTRRKYPVLGSSVALVASVAFLAGCAGEKPFAKINGVTVTQEEYVHALERQNVVVPGGQQTNAERLVIDQLIGNKVIMAEAVKANVLPTEDDVTRYFTLQKNLFEAQYPGKKYETSMAEQGTTAEEVKNDMKMQMAEANLYAKKLNVTDKELREVYDKQPNVGLPQRVQMRLILVAPNSPDFQQVTKAFKDKKQFDEIAKQYNPSQLKATGGLMPQATPINQIGPEFQNKVKQLAEGQFFGPVDFSLPNTPQKAKAWVKIEKQLPAYSISFDDALPLLRRQLVQAKLADPNNLKVRDEIMNVKLGAKFEPTDTTHQTVWDSLKKTAQEAGLGRMGATAAAPATGTGTAAATVLGN